MTRKEILATLVGTAGVLCAQQPAKKPEQTDASELTSGSVIMNTWTPPEPKLELFFDETGKDGLTKITVHYAGKIKVITPEQIWNLLERFFPAM